MRCDRRIVTPARHPFWRPSAIFILALLGLFSLAPPAYCVTASVSASMTADGLAANITVTGGGSCGTSNFYIGVDTPAENGYFGSCEGTCSLQLVRSMVCASRGSHTINARVTGGEAGPNGSCTPAPDGNASTNVGITRYGSVFVVPHRRERVNGGGWGLWADVSASLYACPGVSPAPPNLGDFWCMASDQGGARHVATQETSLDHWLWYSVAFHDPGSSDAIEVGLWGCNELQDQAAAVVPGKDNECDSCPDPSQVGKPIKVTNGNMRYVDGEPLPTGPFAFRRTYDSTRMDEPRLFGHGWSSPFDAYLVTETLYNGVHRVAVATPEGNRRLFDNSGAGYVQKHPLGEKPASFSYDSATDLYMLREYGSDTATYYTGSTGKIARMRSLSSGREVTFTFTNSLPTAVDDSWGNWSWSVSTSVGRIASIAVAGQPIVWNYSYDGGSNLTAVDLNGVSWRSYAYVAGGLSSATDAAGNLIESHTYNDDGYAISSVSASDDVSSVGYAFGSGGTYTSDGGLVETEDTAQTTWTSGAVTTSTIRFIAGRFRVVQTSGGCVSCGIQDVTYSYDDAGQRTRIQDARGYITTQSFDDHGRVLSQSGPFQPSGCDPETSLSRCRLSADALRDVVPQTTAATRTIAYIYGDATWTDRPTSISTASVLLPYQPRTETLTYDAATGVALSHVVRGLTGTPPAAQDIPTLTALYNGTEGAAFDPGSVFSSGWSALPQPLGLRKSVDGPRSDVADVTTFVYYPINASVPAALRGHLAAVRNAAGHVTQFAGYDVFGNATRVVDPNNVATESTYDNLGRNVTSTLKGVAGCDTAADPLCATDLTSSRTYTPVTGPLTLSQRPGGGVTVWTYDDRGRLATQSRGASVSTLTERLSYTYDPLSGKKNSDQSLGFESGAWTIKRSDAYTYNALGLLATVNHPDGSSAGYTYGPDGSIATARDENHTAPNTTYGYDPAGRLTSVTQTLATATGGQIETHYAYDIQGNLTSVTDPNGNVTSYVYDDFGRMLSQSSPVTGTTVYSYDLAGNLVSTTDANGATTMRTYDSLNRVLTANSTLSGANDEDVVYTYDTAAEGGFGVGRLGELDSPALSTTYAYDRRGLLTTSVDDDYETTFGYDVDGNRTTVGYPSGQVVSYSYDFAGRPIATSSASSAFITAASYLPFGPMASMTYGNGSTKTMQYDARYRPSENKLTTATAVIADYIYQNDPAGNITQIHDAVDARYNRDFGYDDLNRLTTANSGASLWGSGSYQYDAMGNMTSLHLGSRSLTFAYDGTTPRLTSVSGSSPATVSYDAAGNEVSLGAYSPRNFLNYVALPSQSRTLNFDYDGRGVRVRATSFGPSGPPGHGGRVGSFRRSLYSPELHLLGQSDWSSDAASGGTEYIWFADQPVAQTFTDPTLPTRYTFTDHLGTPLLQTSSTSSVVWRAEYEPYGSVYSYRVGDASDPQALRLPGQELGEFSNSDKESAYNIFRWYSSGWGRYTQGDPIALRGGVNLFSYVLDNPERWADRTGLSVRRCCRPSNSLDPAGLSALGNRFDHCWIVTDKHAAGYGPAGGGCQKVFTKVIDETPDMADPRTHCEDLPNVDELCLNSALESGPDAIGSTHGLFFPPINYCNSWVQRTIAKCPKSKCNMQPPDWTQDLENRQRWGSGMGPK